MTDTEKPKQALTKEDVIKNISHTLAQRREARGLSLQKVNASIKIRIPLLTAIESANWDELPGDVYVKGFVVRYAEFLGLDGQSLIQPYLEFSKNPLEQLDDVPADSSGTGRARLFIILGVIGLVALFLAARFFILNRLTASPIKSDTIKTVQTETVSVSTNAVVNPPISTRHNLKIYTMYDVWLRVTTDKKSFEGNIPQHSTWTFDGDGLFKIKLGHTKEITVYFDGQPVKVTPNQTRLSLPHEN